MNNNDYSAVGMLEKVVTSFNPLKSKAILLQAPDDLLSVQLYTLIHINIISFD